MDRVILVRKINKQPLLQMYKITQKSKIIKIIETPAYIGKNGMTLYKKEGDGKTPKGRFNIGKVFGISKVNLNKSIDYIKVNKNLYWVDDVNSKWYNQLVDITKVNKDWITAEHLIDYKVQYEYGIEIRTNPNNVKGRGSAIFLHCTNCKPTEGCIAVKKDEMLEILKNIDKDTIIYIL